MFWIPPLLTIYSIDVSCGLSAVATGENIAFLAIKSMLDSLYKKIFQLLKLLGKIASSFIQMTFSSQCFDPLVFLFVCLIACSISL